MFERRGPLLARLLEATGVEGIIARGERGLAEKEGIPAEFEEVIGSLPNGPVSIVENELTYLVDLGRGQKTGFYLDQRDNRVAAASYCRGRRVLDLFCFTGGFSFNARRHGEADSVLGVESSAPAVARARENAARNGIDRVRFEEGKVLPVLERLRTEGERFGTVICDPPKYAQRGMDVDHALKGYLRLNRAALEVLEPGGVLVTCSCSGSIDRALFAQLLGQVAEQSGRDLQILDQRGQPPDHPVSASCLETEYLKCFICRVS
jgi:23S rRNA (cytosine1962-C5)-methyltransferase